MIQRDLISAFLDVCECTDSSALKQQSCAGLKPGEARRSCSTWGMMTSMRRLCTVSACRLCRSKLTGSHAKLTSTTARFGWKIEPVIKKLAWLWPQTTRPSFCCNYAIGVYLGLYISTSLACFAGLHIFTVQNLSFAHIRERERENSNSKTLFYKDCSLGSVKNLTTCPCLRMSRYQITGIIYTNE